MSSTAEFPWTDAFLLGYAPMDDTHREFVKIVDVMLSASDDEFAAHVDIFLKHAEEHFEMERAWMIATDFPATDCHVNEHETVLKSVREVADHIATGGAIAMCRPLVDELVRWFPGHADYMDASLAQWVVKRRLGGTPVVLRRGVLKELIAEGENI